MIRVTLEKDEAKKDENSISGVQALIVATATRVPLDEAGKFLAWHSYKKDTTGWELDGLINSKVLLAKR